MKVYFKEYGWLRVSFVEWLRAKLYCRKGHVWYSIGPVCECGSDNCYACYGCGYITHD